MRKIVLKSVLVFLFATGLLAGKAVASPVYFDLAGEAGGSSVNFINYSEGILGFGDGSTLEVALALGLDQVNFTLDEGQVSDPFDFITFSAAGTGIGYFSLDARMAFDSPDVDDATASGDGGWGSIEIPGILQWIFGLEASYQGGGLFWANNSIELTDSWGNDITVTLEQGITLVENRTTNIRAQITNHGGGAVPVPEPTTMLLLSTGLVGLVGVAMKKKK
jgi:hypothetical protein